MIISRSCYFAECSSTRGPASSDWNIGRRAWTNAPSGRTVIQVRKIWQSSKGQLLKRKTRKGMSERSCEIRGQENPKDGVQVQGAECVRRVQGPEKGMFFRMCLLLVQVQLLKSLGQAVHHLPHSPPPPLSRAVQSIQGKFHSGALAAGALAQVVLVSCSHCILHCHTWQKKKKMQ